MAGMTDHAAQSRHLLARELETRQEISRHLSAPDHPTLPTEVDRAAVSALQHRQRQQIKRAEIHALLAISGSIDDLRADLRDQHDAGRRAARHLDADLAAAVDLANGSTR